MGSDGYQYQTAAGKNFTKKLNIKIFQFLKLTHSTSKMSLDCTILSGMFGSGQQINLLGIMTMNLMSILRDHPAVRIMSKRVVLSYLIRNTLIGSGRS